MGSGGEGKNDTRLILKQFFFMCLKIFDSLSTPSSRPQNLAKSEMREQKQAPAENLCMRRRRKKAGEFLN